MAPFLIHMGDLGMELLTKKGEKFYIDEADYALVCQYVWYLSARGYITTTLQRNGRKNPCQLNLHRLLIPTDGSVDIDHINGNKLDNRRSNLRVCTHWENSCNQRKRCTNTTGFTGVSYLKCAKKYESYIWSHCKKIHLGLFDNPIQAAKVRDQAALKYHGEFAHLNFGGYCYANA